MNDLIDRQAAIDALKDMYHATEKWGEEASDDVIKARAESCMASLVEMKLRIEQLPSAQPTQSNAVQHVESVESVGDCISRQSAINAASYECGELRGVFGRIEERLLALPSAQPSITLKDAVSALRRFLEDRGEFGYFPYTWEFHTKDGACLKTDWGYFEEGLDSIDQYIEAGGMNPNLGAEMRGENDE